VFRFFKEPAGEIYAAFFLQDLVSWGRVVTDDLQEELLWAMEPLVRLVFYLPQPDSLLMLVQGQPIRDPFEPLDSRPGEYKADRMRKATEIIKNDDHMYNQDHEGPKYDFITNLLSLPCLRRLHPQIDWNMLKKRMEGVQVQWAHSKQAHEMAWERASKEEREAYEKRWLECAGY
jgi:hypothetical protein